MSKQGATLQGNQALFFLQHDAVAVSAYNLWINSGDERDRTANLLVANQALSQLSYVPAQILECRMPAILKWYRLECRSLPDNDSGI